MMIGVVKGSVVSTNKSETLLGLKLLVVVLRHSMWAGLSWPSSLADDSKQRSVPSNRAVGGPGPIYGVAGAGEQSRTP